MSWLSVASLIIAVGACAACFVLFRRLQQHERRHQALINVLRNEIQAMTNSSIGMGRRLIGVEQKLNLTVDKQLELENRDPTALAYNQATRLMEMGADVDDLVQNCGIGRPEAELMALLHKELHTPHQSLGRDN
ncbi:MULTISPECIES: DUF2802 domain-containing protein [unclassified Neptuniibacter]|uniref:DUF2802 domain-containing protein n=1 Tax=unclassified Neptuniibacter TaxID=2630693 RepID=UPI0026E493F5|nr:MULTISPECIES: DUF2802 domain-containing protein [unclassified Neptuniibacter]MDO6515568.1 DUF2802 domain-containing protein [Neptuniibacter sp. 2_MG-2023]MDO6595240.1 DUF2802 domain-containing protein [Neptuniibacter sp. 1_MG-2023]